MPLKGPCYRWLFCLMAIVVLAGAVRAAERTARVGERARYSQHMAFEAQAERASFEDPSVPVESETSPPYDDAPDNESDTAAEAIPPIAEGSEAYFEVLEGHLTEGEWYGDENSGGEWYGEQPCLGCGEPGDCCSCEYGDFCGHPAPWFALSEAIFTQRQRSRNRIVSRDRADPIQVISGNQLITIANATAVMGTKSVGAFDFDPGFRFTLGRYLGRDMLNRDHTLEFTYFGLLEWDGSASVRSLVDNFGVPLPGDSSTLIALGGSLVTDFPIAFPATGEPSVGGFNYVQTHYIEYWSRVNNFELNYRLRRSLGRDSLVGCSDGSWQRQLTPGHTPSIFGGIRYFEMDERFYLLSQGQYVSFVGVGPSTGEYTIHSRNRLIGAQLGGDLIDEHIKWNWGARGKAGLYANLAEQQSQVLINASTLAFTVGNQFTSGSDQRLAFIGEIGFVGNYRWRPNVTFHAAWDMMWVQRLALAPEQLNFTFPQTDFITTTGRVFFNTFSVGAEVAW
jgi:hypothetical protein